MCIMESKPDHNDRLYYSIGEVAKLLGESPSLIRYWEEQFDDLKPRRSAGGTRYFTRDDIVTLRAIHTMLKKQGYTIRGAQEKLQEKGSARLSRERTVMLLEDLRGILLKMKDALPGDQ